MYPSRDFVKLFFYSNRNFMCMCVCVCVNHFIIIWQAGFVCLLNLIINNKNDNDSVSFFSGHLMKFFFLHLLIINQAILSWNMWNDKFLGHGWWWWWWKKNPNGSKIFSTTTTTIHAHAVLWIFFYFQFH